METNMKIKKIIMTIILSISMLFSLLTIKNQAVNETNEVGDNIVTQNTTNTQTTQNIEAQNTSSTNNKVVEKSSNANLSNLGIRPNDFSGFKYGTTSYEVAVPENIQEVEVYASAQDGKATIAGTGKKMLEKGENKVEVLVTAEDGTTKTYTINIIREIQQENYEGTEEIANQEMGNGLAELKINDLSLSPEFKTNIYEYTVKYIGEDVKLNIEAKPTQEDYVVEIIGNDNLQEGESYITILVSEENGDNVATYQITVNKSLVDEEAIAKEEALKKANQQKIIIGIAVVAVIVIVVIIVVVIKRKRNMELEEEFSGRSPYDRNYEEDFDDEEDEEEMPKAFKGKRFYDEEPEEKEEIEEEKKAKNEVKDDILEEDYEKMSKDELKQRFLKGYDSRNRF